MKIRSIDSQPKPEFDKKSAKLRKTLFNYSISGGLVTIFFALVLLSIFFAISPHEAKLVEGDISLRDVYAPFDFVYPWGVDEQKTELMYKEASESVAPVFDIDNKIEQQIIDKINAFFVKIVLLQQTDDKALKAEKIKELESELGVDLSKNALSVFLEIPYTDDINIKTKDIANSLLARYVIADDVKKDLQNKKATSLYVRDLNLKTEKEIKLKDIPALSSAKELVPKHAAASFQDNKHLQEASSEIVSQLLMANIVFNVQETNARIQRTLEGLAPIYNMVESKKNELVVGKGTRITKRHKIQLDHINELWGVATKGVYFVGISLLLLISIIIAGFYLGLAEKKTFSQRKNIVMVMVISYIVILAALIIIQSPQPSYLIPMASAGMLLVLLLNLNTAFITTFFLCIFVSVIAGEKLDTFIVFIIGSMVGIYAVRDARRRSQILLSGIFVGLANFVVICYVGFLHNLEVLVFLKEGMWGLANGLLSSFIVLGLLPVFEYIFKITTNVTLLEMLDLNQPLLKELTIKAPGTYHHSILVGNLAEAACDAIGANSLLARVGSYYHDIGKIEKAEYFSENEMGANSKHDKLSPSMSALIITSHVKDGIESAHKYKLNKSISDFITQHHGSSIIYYFYQRALEKTKDEKSLKEEDFRYPGPKPQTKEVAIVLLADSVEASSRTLSDPTPARIRGLVQKIINNRFIDNQLDECDITLKDLNRIAEAFVRVLTGVFHTRLEYPEIRKIGDKNKHKESK